MTRLIGLLAVAFVLVACAPVPRDQPKTVSFAEPANRAGLIESRAAAVNKTGSAGQSTFAPLNDGHEGLGARLRLIEQAEYSVDLQYFLMKEDLASALINDALLDAADRGVRVRFLLDDIFTTVPDELLGLLNKYPNIEVRLFNPAARPGPKKASLATDFSRINRRMHNKTFVVDGAAAIIGGRNIADEYYQIDTTTVFADLDLVIVGPVVEDISKSFDLYWNDEWAVPMEVVSKEPTEEEMLRARITLTQLLIPAEDQYRRAVDDPHLRRLRQGKAPLYRGHAQTVYDSPDKLKVPLRKGERKLAETLLTRFKDAEQEVVLLTPYFVPEDYGAELFADLARRGVSVTIVTNSLLATNHTYVQAGYERHRKMLLSAGVKIYEIRADSLQVLGLVPPDSETKITMHTKLAVIDGETVFVGSMNLDPRSIKQNSEFGAFIDSREFAQSLLDRFVVGIREYTYRISLTPEGELNWNYDNPAAASVQTTEPGRDFKNSTIIGLARMLGIELQL